MTVMTHVWSVGGVMTNTCGCLWNVKCGVLVEWWHVVSTVTSRYGVWQNDDMRVGGVLVEGWHACGVLGGTVADFWSIGGVKAFACWLWSVDIMRVYDVCDVGAMMTYLWTIGGVIACTCGEVKWWCVCSTGGVTDRVRKRLWGWQGKQVPPKGKLNWNKNCFDIWALITLRFFVWYMHLFC